MQKIFKMSLLSMSALLLMQNQLHAVELNEALDISDEMALEAGMTPVELMPWQNMKSAVVNTVTNANLSRAIQSHRLVIAINKKASGSGAQNLAMYENGAEVLNTVVSTGKEVQVTAKSGKVYVSTTPVGFFRPTSMYRDYHSYAWDAPMPNAVFFVGGIAIHATGESNYKFLGTRASGGCVRTKLEESKIIREKIMETGRGQDFRIVNEGKGRNRVVGNSVKVDGIARSSGDMLNTKVESWDTVIVVYQ
jgi:hypothetical protein